MNQLLTVKQVAELGVPRLTLQKMQDERVLPAGPIGLPAARAAGHRSSSAFHVRGRWFRCGGPIACVERGSKPLIPHATNTAPSISSPTSGRAGTDVVLASPG